MQWKWLEPNCVLLLRSWQVAMALEDIKDIQSMMAGCYQNRLSSFGHQEESSFSYRYCFIYTFMLDLFLLFFMVWYVIWCVSIIFIFDIFALQSCGSFLFFSLLSSLIHLIWSWTEDISKYLASGFPMQTNSIEHWYISWYLVYLQCVRYHNRT